MREGREGGRVRRGREGGREEGRGGREGGRERERERGWNDVADTSLPRGLSVLSTSAGLFFWKKKSLD